MIKRNYSLLIFFSFFLVISCIYFLPFLKMPAFNLIDDGLSLKISREILTEGNFSGLNEINKGRLRPLYWLYFSLIYIFSNSNPLGFWIGQTVVFSLTLFSIWYLLKDQVNKYLIAFFLPILFFIPAVSANLFRLGTAEVRQMLFIVWFMIWMKKSIKNKTHNWVGWLFFLAAVFTKETSILLMPMMLVFLLPYIFKKYKKHKKKLCLLLFFSFFSLIFYSLITTMKSISSYTAGFSISFIQIKNNLLISRLAMSEIYYIFFALLALGSIRFLLFLIEKKVFTIKKENYIFKVMLDFWQDNSLLLSNLTGLFISLFFVFSWEYQLERYYYPIYIYLFIYIVLEFSKSIKLFLGLKKNKYKLSMISLPIILLLASYLTFFQKTLPDLKNYLITNNQIRDRWYAGYQNSYNIIRVLLAEETNEMYTLIDDYEVVYELGLFTNKLDFEKNKGSCPDKLIKC
jgi:hypothetical protein